MTFMGGRSFHDVINHNVWLSEQYGCCLFVQSVNSESYRWSFTFKGAMEWNKLPSNLRGVGSAATFKSLLKKHIQHSYFSEFV